MLRLIRDARYARRTSEILQANREADAVGMLSERELAKCIEQLRRDPSDYGIPARKIRAQGRHAEQSLHAALADPGFVALTTDSQGILDDSPAETALNLLADCGSEHSIPTVQRFLDHPQLGRTALRVFLEHCTPNSSPPPRPMPTAWGKMHAVGCGWESATVSIRTMGMTSSERSPPLG